MSSSPLTPRATPSHRSGHGRMHLLMLFVTVCWASNIIAGKQALTGFSALALAELRMLGAAIIFSALFVPVAAQRRCRFSGGKQFVLLVFAAAAMALNQLGFIGGMALSTVAHAGLIVALGPVMVLIIVVVMRMEALTAGKFAGMLIAFAGVGILTSDKTGQGSAGHWRGDLILLGSTLVFAVYTVLMKEVANHYDTWTLNALVFVMTTLMLLPVCTHSMLATRWSALTLEAWWGLAFMVIFGTVASYLLFAYVMRELAASRVAAFNYLQPVIASGLGIWVLSERLTSKVLVGGMIILAGVYLTERDRGEALTPSEQPARCAADAG